MTTTQEQTLGLTAREAVRDLINSTEGAGTLRELTELRTLVEQGVAYNVHALRQVGVSWDEIGRALGVSRQAAWERYA